METEFKVAATRQIGSAVLQEMAGGWEDRTRFEKGGQVTMVGSYEDVFLLDGKAYISPYYTGFYDWTEMEPLEALTIIAVGVENPSDQAEADGQVEVSDET